jgi:mRNA-degrading endonuclease RelE of RelBE toxin-antitoxin system
MTYSLFFAASFKRSLKLLGKKYPHVKDDVRSALRLLERSPQLGEVIPGSGGIRKLRLPNTDAARGKSGGYRLLYVLRPDRELIGLLLLYSKSEHADVVKTELIRLLRSLSQDLGEDFIHDEQAEYQVENTS